MLTRIKLALSLVMLTILAILSLVFLVPQISSAKTNTFATNQVQQNTLDIIDINRFHYDSTFNEEEIRRFLKSQPGRLSTISKASTFMPQDAAKLIAGASVQGINPKVFITLIEMLSGSVTDGSKTDADLDLPFGLGTKIIVGFDRQMDWASEGLKNYFNAYAVDPSQQQIKFKTRQTITSTKGINASTYAIQAFIAETTDETTWKELVGNSPKGFAATYKRLFNEEATAVLTLSPSVSPNANIGLTSPFNGAYDNSDGRINSWFDHAYPTYGNDTHLTHYTGGTPRYGPVNDCTPGYSCYGGHDGIDYRNSAGLDIKAAAPGTLRRYTNTRCGTTHHYIEITHNNGYKTYYGHLASFDQNAPDGQPVSRGQRIATMGNTGCSEGVHLHFSVYYNGKVTDPFGWSGGGTDPCAINNTCTAGQWLWQSGNGPIVDGDLIKGSGLAVFVYYKGVRFFIPNPQVAADSGYDLNTVTTLLDNELNAIPFAPDGTLITEPRDPAPWRGEWVIYKGVRFGIPSQAVFDGSGYDRAKLITLPRAMFDTFVAYGEGTLITEPQHLPNWRGWFVIYKRVKFGIPTREIFDASGYLVDNIAILPRPMFETIAEYGDGTLITEPQNLPNWRGWWAIYGRVRFGIPSRAVFDAAGYNDANIAVLPRPMFDTVSADSHNLLLKNPNPGNLYIIQYAKRRYFFNYQTFYAWGFQESNIHTMPDAMLNIFPNDIPVQFPVKKTGDAGNINDVGSLSYALNWVSTGQTITLLPDGGTQVNVQGALPALKTSVNIVNSCNSRVTINGSAPTAQTNGLTLSGNNYIEGVIFSGFRGKQLDMSLGKGYRFKCTSVRAGS
jgi:murein DD-endopeptidase MepM/ murein hydrolase activator NlpD